MELKDYEMSRLIWFLHYKEQFTLKSIARVLKIPYWKVHTLCTEFEMDRVAILTEYQEKYDVYVRDSQRKDTLLWRIRAKLGLWIPAEEPGSPVFRHVETSDNFKDQYQGYVKRLDYIKKSKKRLPVARKKQPIPQDITDILGVISKIFE